MAENREWLVSMSPVRNADRRVAPVGLSVPAPQRTARVAELRRLALRGYYASESMMVLVARRLLASGDL